MSSFARLAVCALALSAAPLAAREANSVSSDPTVQDVAMTPLTDLNLAKAPIPAVLLRADADPYASTGIASCADIQAELDQLDAALGPDADVNRQNRERISWGRIATSAVGSFIPFRGVIRELSGAADHERDFKAAIVSGAVRRGVLKGLGQQRNCPYPARPAFTRVVFEQRAAPVPTPSPRGKVTVISKEVVQPLPVSAVRK
ncbi:MAG: hypothetical protein ACTHKM_05925 [Tsuneonella sp.]